MTSEKLAKYISIILGPEVWFPVIFLLVILKTDLKIAYPEITIPLVFIFQIILPFVGPLIDYKDGKIHNLDIPVRENRIKYMLIATLSWLTSLIIIYSFGNSTLLKLTLIIFILIFIMFLITSFWKISIHAAVTTAGVLFVNYLYNWQFLWLFVLIPIVAWARYKLKAHTISQLIAGFLVTAFVVLVYIKLIQ